MSEEQIKELYMELQAIQEAAGQLQQQLQMLNQQQEEMKHTIVSLNQFETLDKDVDAYVPLSSGIFAKAIVKKPEKLLVNVGAGVTVAKTVPQTRDVIQEQIKDSEKFERQLTDQLEKFSTRAEKVKKQMKALMPK